MNISLSHASSYALVLFALLVNGCSMSASSSSIPLNQNSSITFTLSGSEIAYICTDQTCYSPRQLAVLLDTAKEADISRVDIDGNVTGLLVVANDKGVAPDLTAGDGIYTGEYVFNESQNGMLRVQGQFADAVEITAGALPTKSELESAGAAVYASYCTSCHRSDGMGLGMSFPALAGSSVVTGYPIADNLNIVMNGSAGSAMSSYDGTLNDDQLAAVITYVRNAFGNNTGDVVYASDIRAYRNAQ